MLFFDEGVLGQVFFHHKIVDNEVLALHGVLAHVVFEELLHLVGLVQGRSEEHTSELQSRI